MNVVGEQQESRAVARKPRDAAAVTCEVKHLQNICKNVTKPSISRGYDMDVKML